MGLNPDTAVPENCRPFIHYRTRPTRSGGHLADMLEKQGRPVVTPSELFVLIRRMYREEREGLFLRKEMPGADDYHRLCRQLNDRNVIRKDADYGDRAWRVHAIADLAADDIVCIIDRFCHVSHLSAMQRWSLTNRTPKALTLTRPDRGTVQARLKALNRREEPSPFPATGIGHPERVRGRPIRLRQARHAGTWVRVPDGFVRMTTIGQTFLDMLQQPDLCGGMPHVLEVWNRHAGDWLDEIIEALDGPSSAVARCRAGHILEERLGIGDARIDAWKSCARRGGSRRLDPFRPFRPEHSEVWMISLNA